MAVPQLPRRFSLALALILALGIVTHSFSFIGSFLFHLFYSSAAFCARSIPQSNLFSLVFSHFFILFAIFLFVFTFDFFPFPFSVSTHFKRVLKIHILFMTCS